MNAGTGIGDIGDTTDENSGFCRRGDGGLHVGVFECSDRERKIMDLLWIGFAFAGYGIMVFLAAKADALKAVADAEADAIRRKADYEFGKDK